MEEPQKIILNEPWRVNLLFVKGGRLRAALNRTKAHTTLDLYRFAKDGKFGKLGMGVVVGKARPVLNLTKGWRKKLDESLRVCGLPPIENAQFVVLQMEKESFAEFERGLRRFLKDRDLPHDPATLHRISEVLLDQPTP